MDPVLERIADWEAAGLIDPATAARLRLAEADRPAEPATPAASAVAEASSAADAPPMRGPSSVAAVFGPGVTIGEMFAYLGGGFLLGAFETFVFRLAGSDNRSELPIAIGSAIAAIALTLFGLNLMNGDPRRRRAAGVLFGLAVAHVGVAAGAVSDVAGLDWPLVGVIGALVASVAAIGLRVLHPSLLTQVALLASITTLAGLVLSLIERIVVPERQFSDSGVPILQPGSPDPIVLVAFTAAWWLVLAVIVGVIGLREAEATDHDPTAGRRASLTRLWAGLVAVIGLSTAVTRSDYTANGDFRRIIEPWLGELAILVLAAILVERAFRRDASTFVYAAALGLMIALSDFNFSYLSSSAELGLLIEGLILLAAGFGADRLRRRLGQSTTRSSAPEAPTAS